MHIGKALLAAGVAIAMGLIPGGSQATPSRARQTHAVPKRPIDGPVEVVKKITTAVGSVRERVHEVKSDPPSVKPGTLSACAREQREAQEQLKAMILSRYRHFLDGADLIKSITDGLSQALTGVIGSKPVRPTGVIGTLGAEVTRDARGAAADLIALVGKDFLTAVQHLTEQCVHAVRKVVVETVGQIQSKTEVARWR
jgi:hypothetical protein